VSDPGTPWAAHRAILNLNSRLLINCLAGVSDGDAERRLSDNTNSMVFIAAHLVDARNFMATLLGLKLPNPVGDALRDVRSINEVTALPSLEAVRAAWRDLAEPLERRAAQVSAEDLAGPSPESFPVEDGSLLGGVAFLLQHESFHIGQLALLRKQLGYPSMEYASDT
jgi:uncharacterized damage-inducible protein DinB